MWIHTLPRWLRQPILRVFPHLGLNLPNRELNLPFGLLPPSSRGKRPELRVHELEKELKPLACENSDPMVLFKTIQAHLSRLNHYKISTYSRRVHTELCLEYFFRSASIQVTALQEHGRVPENPRRREFLETIMEVSRILQISLKHIFQQDYDRPNRHYAKVRDRVHWSAFRLLELIRLEQRVCGLRYKRMRPDAWRDANAVFTVMFLYESVDGPQRLLQRIKEKYAMGRCRDESTLLELYSLIQLSGVLDIFYWPTVLQGVTESYIRSLDRPVTIHEDGGAPVGKDAVVTGFDLNRPPLFKRPPKAQGPAMFIDFHVLAESIRRDYKAIGESQSLGNPFMVPSHFRNLDHAYRVPILRMMWQQLAKDSWEGAAGGAVQEKDLRLYSGFSEVYQHLSHIFVPNSIHEDTKRFRNLLAQKSAMIGTDEKAEVDTRWFILEDTAERLRVRTNESRFTVVMYVGGLLAFGFGEDGIQQPALGFVERLERPNGGQVYVVLRRMVTFAEPVVVKKRVTGDASEEINKPVAALLVHDNQEGWGLLIPQHPAYWHQTEILLVRGQAKLRFTLGRLRHVSHEFLIFPLAGEDVRQLGIPRYPFFVPSAEPEFKGHLIDDVEDEDGAIPGAKPDTPKVFRGANAMS